MLDFDLTGLLDLTYLLNVSKNFIYNQSSCQLPILLYVHIENIMAEICVQWEYLHGGYCVDCTGCIKKMNNYKMA